MERVTFLVESSGERIECLLNPETVVLRRQAGMVRHAALSVEPEGAIEDLIVRVGGGVTELELELLFDVQIASPPVNVDDVRKLTSKLWELTEREGDQMRAPIVRMFWGKVFSMRVVFEALAERLDAIGASGAARRSWLAARLIRVADPPRRTVEDVLVNPRPPTPPGDDAGTTDVAPSSVGAEETPPDAEELEQRAAVESGLWGWVRRVVEGADTTPNDAVDVGEEADDSETAADLADVRGEPDDAVTASNEATEVVDTDSGDHVDAEDKAVEAEAIPDGTSEEPVIFDPPSAAARRTGPSDVASSVAAVEPAPEEVVTAGTGRSPETEASPPKHGALYRLLVATPAQVAQRLCEAVCSVLETPARPRAASAEEETVAGETRTTRSHDSETIARVETTLREVASNPSQLTEQFERYAESLERQCVAAIRAAQAEQTRAFERTMRQSSQLLQRSMKDASVVQRQVARQYQALQRQNLAQLNALTERVGQVNDRAVDALQAGLRAQSEASERLLTQITDSWSRGEREQARRLEELLMKQAATLRACEASGVALGREPRTELLSAALTTLGGAEEHFSPELRRSLVDAISTLLSFHVSLAAALEPVVRTFLDDQASVEQWTRARAAAVSVLEREANERGSSRVRSLNGALDPVSSTATRLDILAAERTGNPAAWREVVQFAPQQRLV